MLKQLVAATVIAGAGVALASPAQDLFDEATFQLGFYYAGPTKIDGFRGLRKQYQPKLDAVCGSDANCSYDKAVPIVREMIAALRDSFTTYMGEEEVQEAEMRSAGAVPETPRLGLVTATLTGRGEVVLEAFGGEAAAQAGLKRGDVIRTVNGAPATAATLAAARSAVKLGIERNGAALEITATPAVAKQAPFITATPMDNGVLYVRIPDFYRNQASPTTGAMFTKMISDAVQGKQKGVIVDVRDSYSGYDTEAFAAAAALTDKIAFTYKPRFTGQDDAFTIKDRVIMYKHGNEEASEYVELAPVESTIPVVVLVNSRTYNASEMFAYWLQKSGRAKVIGEATAGQLSVSGGYDPTWQLPNGGFLNVTTLRLHNEDGSLFPEKVTPDVVVPEDLTVLATGRDPYLEKALEILGAR